MEHHSTEAAPSANGETAEFLTLTELARLIRCSQRTVQRLLAVGEGPRAIRISPRRLIFARSDALAWALARAQHPGPDMNHQGRRRHSSRKGPGVATGVCK